MNHLPEKMRPYRDLLEKSAKEYVKLNVRKGKTGRYDSKIAGDPYFPKHETYPTDENGQPMKLLAQINFSHIPQLDGYPSSGILQFYISIHDDVYGLNFDDRCEQKDFRVIYFENIIENEDELVSDFSFIGTGECDFPILSEAAVEPVKSSEWVLPTDFQFEQYTGMETMEFFGQFDEDEEDIYNELAENDLAIKSADTLLLPSMIRGNTHIKNTPSCFYKLIQTMISIQCGETSASPIFSSHLTI